MNLIATVWEELLWPVWFPMGVLALSVIALIVIAILKKFFPCAGDWLHDCYGVGPPGVVGQRRSVCRRCGASWVLDDKCYSIASDGDPDSYLPVWRRDDHVVTRSGMDDVD